MLRAQSVAASTAQKLGFGSAVSVDASGDASKLIYELFLRKALQATNLQDGIASMRGEFAGFLLITSLDHVDSKLTTSFPAVSAASSLGLARATFEMQTWAWIPR